ncbi:MAG: hypothetical protein A2275_10125 [Bacteroidetes bacterium RIFOXYA12_FULL_35_11]|nr:MAG: hypothetical protein A2X01_07525 [Bacteroidetes bacterium GWF2_35_48]OFY73696.1 MAG: hypothetical protein A2275_10125 [Bacteroidetes bacterium RIFOXYA12_FULL_35_11]OFY92784.1 MAG: hypothetical protein A2491_05790 [Bacteroidetes bacterium RIFOXYC12_FULL_35_7]HBX52904.1 glycosyl transferase [Bacteroidales bacterium]
MFFIFLTILFLFGYILLVALLIYGWAKNKKFIPSNQIPTTRVSVLIAIRNEEKNIGNLLHDLTQQTFPKSLSEIIIVDDHSTDRSREIVFSFTQKYPNIKLFSCWETQNGKKQALKIGLQQANGVVIVTCDGDCRMGEKWLHSIVSYYEIHKPKMIINPVIFEDEKTFFQKIQSLEFMSLIGATAGLAGIKKPIMCNGANLAYEREIISEQNNFFNDKLASGDDVFLLHHIKKTDRKKIHFFKSKEAIVTTKAQATFNAFVNQRLRWASKSKNYTDADSLIVSTLIFFSNLIFPVLLAASLFDFFFLYLFAGAFLLKSFIDFIFLYQICGFFEKKKLLIWFFPVQFFYFSYIAIIGLLSLFIKPEWKGRK